AEGWVDIQREEFKRLGVTGMWADPYLTMDFHAEAVIAAEFMSFLMNGTLYQGSKPVMWSPVEKTALAEAEVEYHDHISPTVWVKFPVVSALPDAEDAVWQRDEHNAQTDGPVIPYEQLKAELSKSSVIIWTTTPW